MENLAELEKDDLHDAFKKSESKRDLLLGHKGAIRKMFAKAKELKKESCEDRFVNYSTNDHC